MNVPFVVSKIWVFVSNPFKTTHVTNICKHKTKQKDFINDGAGITIMEMPLAKNGHPDYCLKCIENMSIQCAWCNKNIAVGSHITLYSPVNKDFEIPKHAIIFNKEHRQLVGCLRWECADSGADRAGFWVPGDNNEGCVERVMSPLESSLMFR